MATCTKVLLAILNLDPQVQRKLCELAQATQTLSTKIHYCLSRRHLRSFVSSDTIEHCTECLQKAYKLLDICIKPKKKLSWERTARYLEFYITDINVCSWNLNDDIVGILHTAEAQQQYKWQWNCGPKWIDFQLQQSQVNPCLSFIK